ncbi:MAG TPA: hypothetical protein VHO70_11020 [Chitinispirillaceae bacterium]|nr:hypothetical protein [Chitinispirillaceae bacterium]
MGTEESARKKTKRFRRPFTIYTLMEWFATILLLLLFIAGIAGLIFPISHPVLVWKVSDYLRNGGVDSCRVGNVTIKIWKGIEITDLYVEKKISSLEKYSFSADKVSINLNLFTSLLNFRKYQEVLLEGHEYIFYELYREPQQYFRMWYQFLNQLKTFKGLNIIEPRLQVDGYDSLHVELTGGVIDISNDYEKKTMDILYQIAVAKVNGYVFEYNKGSLLIDERDLKIIKSKGRYLNGKYKISGDVDLSQTRLRLVQIGVADLQMNSLHLRDDSLSGKIEGIIHIDLKLEPSSFNRDSLKGSGVITLDNATITGTGFQNSLKALIMSSQIDTLHFGKIKNDFDLKKNMTFFNKTQGEGEGIAFSARGWIQPDGSLNQNFEAMFNPSFVNELPSVVAGSLLDGENNNKIFRCKVYGNAASPRVELDSTVLRKAIGSVFDDMKQNFKQLFRKINPGD